MFKKLPIFSSREGQVKYQAAYENTFSLWPVPHEALEVQTRYGLTHINATGPTGASPLVLLHGAGLSSTVWFKNVAELSADHRVYAVDVMGDAGKSVPVSIMRQKVDYAHWLKAVLDALELDQCCLLGHSQGGWLTINMALQYPQRLKKIILLAPAASIHPLSLLSKTFLRLAELKIRFPVKKTLRASLSRQTVLEDAFVHQMDMVNKYCFPVTLFPTVFSDHELSRIKLPVLLLIGENEKIYNPDAALKRAAKWIPDLTAEIIPNAGHLLIMDQPKLIAARISDFLKGTPSTINHRYYYAQN